MKKVIMVLSLVTVLVGGALVVNKEQAQQPTKTQNVAYDPGVGASMTTLS